MQLRHGGTVTFVFTDIEGSTRLVRELGEGYGAVQGEHRRLIREAFGAQGGEEVDTQGDSFLYVFRRAREAALAAADAQRALAAHRWPDGVELRVRMGMHTAEPSVSDAGYHGLGVHRAARVMGAGHGGQILVSQATASVLSDDRLPGVELRDLGEHRLKDLDRPERIHQLDVEGLPTSFAPLETAEPPRAPVHRRPVFIGAVAGVLAAAVAIPVFALGRGSDGRGGSANITGNAVAVVDPSSGDVVAATADVPSPGHAAAGAGAVWVTSSKGGGTVFRLDASSGDITDTIEVGSGAAGIAFGAGDVWVANSLDGTVSRVDGETAEALESIDVGNEPAAVAFGAGAVWVTNAADGSVSKLDPVSGAVRATFDVGAAGRGIAVAEGGVWLADAPRNRVIRVDPTSGSVTDEVNVGSGPTGIAYGGGSLWVTNSLDGTVTAVSAATASVRATVPAGTAPSGVAVSPGDVWVTDEVSGSIVRIDTGTLETARTTIGGRPHGLVSAAGSLWVAVQPAVSSHRGGVLRLVAGREEVDFVDPAKAYQSFSWRLLASTHDGLVGLKKTGGTGGNTLVPDLAQALPKATNGGKVYTFRLRRGIRFSDGRLLKPSDVQASLERLFRARSQRVDFYEAVIGADACRRQPGSCSLARGVVADDRAGTVTFRLSKPDGELLHKLAIPFAFVVPAGTPVADRPVPGTGPYRMASYRPGRDVRLVRNRHFRVWSHAAQPEGVVDEVRVTLGGDTTDHADAVARGRADALASFPQQRLAAERARSPAQVHITPAAVTFVVALDVHRPPFSNRLARRALAFALDRREMVEQFGGPSLSAPTCQVLPPNSPAHERHCPYTVSPSEGGEWKAPDLYRADELVTRSGTRGMRVDVLVASAPADFVGPSRVLRRTLERLGYDVRARSVAGAEAYFDNFYGAADTIEAAVTGWVPDYSAPSTFFELVRCQGSPYTCTPALDARIANALAVQGRDPGAALRLWRELDRAVVNDALIVPFVNWREIDFVSRRLGNYQRHPVFGLLLSQVWVR